MIDYKEKGERILPPLFFGEKSEDDIQNFSPRKFKIGEKSYISKALPIYQDRLFLSTILKMLLFQDENEIKKYFLDENRELLFDEFSVNLENNFNISFELIIMSCINYEVNKLLIRSFEIKDEIEAISLDEKFNLKKIKNYIKLKSHNQELIKIEEKIKKIIYEASCNASKLQWNIAFNYIIEQNNILKRASELVKKKKKQLDTTTTQ